MNNQLRPILEASYSKNKKANSLLAGQNYTLDKRLSTKEAKVFISPNGTPNIAVRGSKSVKDFLISDPLLALGLGNLDPRQKATDKLIKKTKKKYGSDPNLYGHSLAGALIDDAKTKGTITTFNKGTGLNGFGKKIKKNQTDIRTSGDLVSLISKTQKGKKKITIKNNNVLKSHGLINLKKLKYI